MRGFDKAAAAAALLLAPVLVGASLFRLEETVPSAFVTLNVPNEKNKAETLTLRLDVGESQQVCGLANVKINGQPLSQSAKGSGHGSLTVEDAAVVDARWIITCVEADGVPVEQLMTFAVEAVNGEAVSDVVAFSASFRQTAPVLITDVGGAALNYRLYMPVSEDDVSTQKAAAAAVARPDSMPKDGPKDNYELQGKLMELELLRKQAHELEDLIREKEDALFERFPDKVAGRRVTRVSRTATACAAWFAPWRGRPPHHPHFHDGPPPPPPFDRPPPPHGPHHGDHPPPPPHHGDHPPPPPGHGDRPPPPPHHGRPDEDKFAMPASSSDSQEHPLVADHDGPPPPPPHHGHEGPDHHHHHPPPPPPEDDLFITIAMAATAFIIFSFVFRFIHRRISGERPSCRRHQSRAERRAARHERRTAVRAYFSRMFLKWGGRDDEAEKEAMLAADVSMAQEIAQFRQAASLVEGLVAAEEGRSRTTTTQQTPPPMVPQHTSPSAVFELDEQLPSYDDESVDSSIVSDGCRYTPGTTVYTPSSNGSNADNVLGDSKQ
ncbi:hypothetical protein G7046_g9690 [Stylonectria norvegica]|nr:hypothetical protein G7046_g9690 [Stylonectria norvegica]